MQQLIDSIHEDVDRNLYTPDMIEEYIREVYGILWSTFATDPIIKFNDYIKETIYETWTEDTSHIQTPSDLCDELIEYIEEEINKEK
jgi:hypothetical protein